ncbi:uncharacterized protein LOC123697789 isoform X1 [Colias croceus]|uniref:uncharacterized protein LOC123697789 isoform X1 n=3 Tax=Colias crocea TaxID=72248 RepID=UPI001E281807|nr:uncharacterized protein LOC123697789 isoform X1 [Colias croceus]
MVIKLGINGFGRIGRVIFRTCLERSDFEVVAINDPAINIEYICYLIKFDSTHGKFSGTVSYYSNEIVIDGKKIMVFHEKLPVNIPWSSIGAQYVIEASGMFTNLEKASGHLKSVGVKRVIVTAPSVDIPMLVVGVNEDMIGIDQKVISCASSTLYCLAPIIKILEDNFGVSEGFITSIHAMTPSLKPLDGLCLRGKHWRDHRSIHQNIIPAATGACKALNKIIPQVKDKMSGLAFRVPIVNVSVLDISIRLNVETSLEEIIQCVQKYSDTNMKNIITISNEESVSSDFLGEDHSCILDTTSSIQLTPNFYKLVCWYENEYSYACRVIDIIHFSEKQHLTAPLSRLTYTHSTSSRGTTTESIRSMFLPRHYRFEVYPNMVCSASQDTGFRMKLPLRSPLTKNTLTIRNSPTNETTLNRVINKTNEIFKVWNDVEVNKDPLRRNTSSFFQSCMALAPGHVERSKYLNNREHLKKVKEEFSKMVTMTEDLLKKSSHSRNKMEDNAEKIPEKNLAENPIMKEDKEEKDVKEVENTQELNPMGGDFNKVNSVTRIFDQSEVKTDPYNKNIVNILKPIKAGDFYENTSYETILLPHQTQINLPHSLCKTPAVCKTVTDPLKTEVPSSPNESEERNEPNSNEIECDKTSFIEIAQNLTEDDAQKVQDTHTNVNNVKNYKSYIISVECNSQSDSNKITAKENHSKVEDDTNKPNIISHKTTENNLQTKQNTVENVLRKYTTNNAFMVSENSTGPRFKRNKQDIFDKLDSASASDSENSFTERKSQIINITDLTNSVEDLARLDKICRIIEISDELSDKLFSTLNDPESMGLEKKAWSFKDLCERLKLDEFCNKIFGQ